MIRILCWPYQSRPGYRGPVMPKPSEKLSLTTEAGTPVTLKGDYP